MAKTPKQKYLIAPSLLASNLANLETEIKNLEKAGADLLHFDIMDGHFVPNITFGFPVIESCRKVTDLPFDAHLMIENADRYIDDFAKAGCNWLSVHIEACPHIHRTLSRIQELGIKAGVAINPATSLDSLNGVLDYCDFVLVMSVNPGFGGQKFIKNSFLRVEELKKKIGKRNILIQIDGGIKLENIKEAAQSGVEVFVVGTGLLASKDYTKQMSLLKKECEKA